MLFHKREMINVKRQTSGMHKLPRLTSPFSRLSFPVSLLTIHYHYPFLHISCICSSVFPLVSGTTFKIKIKAITEVIMYIQKV